MTDLPAVNTEQLKRKLLRMSAQVEEVTARSLIAFRMRDAQSAEALLAMDSEINRMEIAIEKDCLALLSAPLSREEVRFVVAVIKINNELERIGDLAGNIARRVVDLGPPDAVRCPAELTSLAEQTQEMLKRSLDSLVDLDADLARSVCANDDEVDSLNRRMYAVIKDRIASDPSQTEIMMNFLSISRYLERIADYATNIAENVVFIGDGSIIRHQH